MSASESTKGRDDGRKERETDRDWPRHLYRPESNTVLPWLSTNATRKKRALEENDRKPRRKDAGRTCMRIGNYYGEIANGSEKVTVTGKPLYVHSLHPPLGITNGMAVTNA